MKQCVRIIGGEFRGKKITFPSVLGLRPTPDRVKETLFNWLMNDIRGARCLDAFAGSGALGFEALSRSAKQVTLLESSALVFRSLEQNAKDFAKGEQLRIFCRDAINFLQSTTETFDLIFLDPPFNTPKLAESLAILSERAVLAPGGLVYVESAEEIQLDTKIWQCLKSKKAGLVNYALFASKAVGMD